MTIYERLFGTPERAARTLEEMMVTTIDICVLMDVFGDRDTKCSNCICAYDGYGCERKDMTISEWLATEVME